MVSALRTLSYVTDMPIRENRAFAHRVLARPGGRGVAHTSRRLHCRRALGSALSVFPSGNASTTKALAMHSAFPQGACHAYRPGDPTVAPNGQGCSNPRDVVQPTAPIKRCDGILSVGAMRAMSPSLSRVQFGERLGQRARAVDGGSVAEVGERAGMIREA